VGALYGIIGPSDGSEARAMGLRLAHRGAESAEWSPASGVRFGVRGSAAVVNAQAGGLLVFDGVVDNREDLARQLGHPGERTDLAGDAALVLELWRAQGVEGLALIAGQFALALWDGATGHLVLARDRVGYAPLYFALAAERLIFASEYKALLALESVPARPNRTAIQTIQSTKWVRPGATCLEGI
jgi:asparagine synthase (glutamine-hydrolysing)